MPGPMGAPNGNAALTANRPVTVCDSHGTQLHRCGPRCRRRTLQNRELLRNSGKLHTGKTAAKRSR